MFKQKSFIYLIILIFVQCCFVLAGLEWQMKFVNKKGKKDVIGEIHLYAQNGNVREEFIKGTTNPLAKEGGYFLYKSEGNTVYFVNPKDKTYAEFPLELMLQSLAASQMMEINISNAKVEVSKLPNETIDSYKCNHLVLNSSYDMKMKIMFMSMEHHIEQIHELWMTKDIAVNEISSVYLDKSFKTGLKGVDELTEKYKDILKDRGFIIKSVMDQKTTDLKTNKTEHSIVEMTAYNIQTKNLDNSLFEIPANYKKIELIPTNLPFGKQK